MEHFIAALDAAIARPFHVWIVVEVFATPITRHTDSLLISTRARSQRGIIGSNSVVEPRFAQSCDALDQRSSVPRRPIGARSRRLPGRGSGCHPALFHRSARSRILSLSSSPLLSTPPAGEAGQELSSPSSIHWNRASRPIWVTDSESSGVTEFTSCQSQELNTWASGSHRRSFASNSWTVIPSPP